MKKILAFVLLSMTIGMIAHAQPVTSQYYTWWGAAKCPVYKLQPTSIIVLFAFNVTTSSPYFTAMNGNDSTTFHGYSPYSGKVGDLEDSLVVFKGLHGTKILISIMSGFNPLDSVLSDTTPNGKCVHAAQNIMWWMNRHPVVDGMEIDWEYPNINSATWAKMAFFLRQCRAIKPNVIVQLTSEQEWDWGNPAFPEYNSTDVALADYVGFMLYNMESPTHCSDNSARYYNAVIHPGSLYWDNTLCWKAAVADGVPVGKIILYTSAEGKKWTGTNLTRGATATETGGTGGYQSMVDQPVYIFSTPGKYQYWDPVTQTSWFLDSLGKTYYSFETYESMYAGANYVKVNGLGGFGAYDFAFRLWDPRQAVPDSAMRGMLAGMGTGTVVINPPPPPPLPPAPLCITQSQIDSIKGTVVCPPSLSCPDTVAIGKRAVTAYKLTIPTTITVHIPPRDTVVATPIP